MFQAAWWKPYVSRNDNVMGYTFWIFYKMKSSFEKSWLTQLIYPWKKQEKTQKSLLVQIIFGKISFLQFWKEGGKLETWTARWNLSTLTFESIYLKNMKKPTCIGTAQQKGGWEASPHSKGLLHHWANNVTYTKKKELEQYLFPNTRFTTIHYKHKHVFYDLWNPFWKYFATGDCIKCFNNVFWNNAWMAYVKSNNKKNCINTTLFPQILCE